MKASFTENESYKHKMAKEVLKEWFFGGQVIGEVGCSWPNRTCGVYLEYPIVKDNKYNSINYSWDEQLRNPSVPIVPHDDYCDDAPLLDEYVPTYAECVALGIYPKRVIDVVMIHKGQPQWFIEICHKNPTSREKIMELKLLGVTNLIEMDAEWILSQTRCPDELKYVRLI